MLKKGVHNTNVKRCVTLLQAIAAVLLVFFIALQSNAEESREFREKNERGKRIIEVDLSKLPPDLAKRLVEEMAEQKGKREARHHEEDGDEEHADKERHEGREHREHSEADERQGRARHHEEDGDEEHRQGTPRRTRTSRTQRSRSIADYSNRTYWSMPFSGNNLTIRFAVAFVHVSPLQLPR